MVQRKLVLKFYASALLLLVCSYPKKLLIAQQGGAVELSAAAAVTQFDRAARLDDAVGYRLGIGVRAAREWQLEATFSYSNPRLIRPSTAFDTETLEQTQLRLLYEPWQGHRVQVYSGVGLSIDSFYLSSETYHDAQSLVLASGLRWSMYTPHLLIRVDGWVYPTRYSSPRSGVSLGIGFVPFRAER